MQHCSVSDDGRGEHCSACLKLQEVQSKIRECKELLDKLYIQEAHAKSSVNAVHDPIIRRLPLELVSDIFTLSNPSLVERGSSLLGDTPVATQRHQFSLGAVCTAWRNTVRSTPQLWTNIWIRLQIRSELPQMEFLLLCLRLSGSLPLHIYAWVPQRREPLEKDYPKLVSLLEALNDHSERWKTLDLCITSRLMSHVKGVSPGSPNLEQLRIRPPILNNPIKSPFRLSFGLPSPHVVNSREIAFQFIGISWKNVTHARLDRLTEGECLELFRRATELEDLVISLLECEESEPFEFGGVVTAPNLSSWKVEFEDMYNLDMLLKICLPSLVHLEIEEFATLDALAHMVTRSNCPLRTISLGQVIGANADLIPILRAAPLLEKVIFTFVSSRRICELLGPLGGTKLVNDLSQDTDVMFLSHLESLSFKGMEYDFTSWHLIPSLFPPTQRPANVQYRPLRKLEFLLEIGSFESDYYLSKDLMLQLLEIKRRGYNLIIFNEGASVVCDLFQVSYDYHFKSQTDTVDDLGVDDGEETEEEESVDAAG